MNIGHDFCIEIQSLRSPIAGDRLIPRAIFSRCLLSKKNVAKIQDGVTVAIAQQAASAAAKAIVRIVNDFSMAFIVLIGHPPSVVDYCGC